MISLLEIFSLVELDPEAKCDITFLSANLSAAALPEQM